MYRGKYFLQQLRVQYGVGSILNLVPSGIGKKFKNRSLKLPARTIVPRYCQPSTINSTSTVRTYATRAGTAVLVRVVTTRKLI